MATSVNSLTSSELFPKASRLLGYSTVGCALMEHDGRIVSVTRSFAEMLDSEVGLLFGQSVFDLMTWDGDLEPGSLLLEGQKMRVVLRGDGRSLFWSTHRIAPGAILGGYYIGMIWDDSELGSFELSLVHRERLATLGGLTAGVAHEIAGPLNIIANNAEFLLDEDGLTPDALQGLTTIRNEAFRLCAVLQDILGFARNAPPDIKVLDAVDLVKKSLELFKNQLFGKKISWRIEAEASLPPVGGEAERLQQVFFNLFKNAWDASPEASEVVIIVRRQRPNRVGAGIEFLIVDKGEGIAPSDLEHICKPFFTTKPAGQGTGLGLAIAQQILAAHQGSLKLASSPGEGTSATVLLPVFQAGEAPLLGV
jgi:signal transduction histidine kinase